MPCYHPLKGYFSSQLNASGKRSLVFSSDKALVASDVLVPCGRCIGCRLDRSLSWAIRCVHEARMHEDNCFVTLTYDKEHLPDDGSLRPRDFVLFMKQLRQFLVSHEWVVSDDGKGEYIPLSRDRWQRVS